MTTPLFLLRCAQVGISIQDLDLLTVGIVLDIFTEKNNDDYKWPKVSTQEVMDKFKTEVIIFVQRPRHKATYD